MTTPTPVFDKADIDANKTIAAVSYLWILSLVVLILKRDSKFAQYHAKQALVLFIIEILGWLLFFIPFLGWLLWLGIVVLAVMGIINALNGVAKPLPVVGTFADKLNF